MSLCQRCGKTIIFAENEQHQKVALEKTDEVYAIVYPGPADRWLTKKAKQEVYVNHTLTCKGKKKK